MPSEVARAADAEAVTELFALGFFEDPVWAWAYDDAETRLEKHRELWGLLVESAIPYGWVRWGEGRAAASLWIPPGRADLSSEGAEAYEPMLRRHLGDRVDEVLELKQGFIENRPSEPHFYLSLLATHPEHRGRGVGGQLLARDLEEIDAEGMPAYLESTSPVNDGLYERHGFVRTGEIVGPGDAPGIACMRRAAT
jgi:GNAT superfamily N-acetyltransferase